ncbi:hypothetical protein T484DRAFT_1615157, partial [Baffinella frigidus]
RTLNPQPSTLNPQPSTLSPPSTLNPQPSTLNPVPTLNPQPSTLNPQPSTLSPPSTLNPHPCPLSPRQGHERRIPLGHFPLSRGPFRLPFLRRSTPASQRSAPPLPTQGYPRTQFKSRL